MRKTIEELKNDIRPTLVLIAEALSDRQETAEDAVWTLRYRANREVFEQASGLCSSELAKERELGVSILSQLGVPRRVFADESTKLLLSMLDSETDASVIKSICYGFGHLRACAAVERLISLSTHESAEIRLAVVNGLAGQETDDSVRCLVGLARDPDREVRNWATFTLASLVESHHPAVTEVMKERLAEDDAEIHGEALVGLARRGEPGILSEIARDLHPDRATVLSLEAASEIGDSTLLQPLLNLRNIWDHDIDLLDMAIRRCSR